MQVGQAFATRSSTESLRTIGLGTNRLMLGIAAGVIALQLAAVYTPLSEFLDLDTLSALDISICALLRHRTPRRHRDGQARQLVAERCELVVRTSRG